MIIVGTRMHVADNSGANIVQRIKVLGGSKIKNAFLADTVVVSVKNATPNSKVKKGEVYKAILVRTKSRSSRSDGSLINFDDNAVVLINKQDELVGTRVFGPVARELRLKNLTKIMSLAPEVL